MDYFVVMFGITIFVLMHTFYCREIINDIALLDESESKHLSQVLRLNEGDIVKIIDGLGMEWEGIVQQLNKKKTQIRLTNILRKESIAPLCSIAICPTKNIDRFEYFLEKATEIGICNIYPILTKRSERKAINIERLDKIILNATKQSGNLFLPILHPLISFKDFFEEIDLASFTFKAMGHCVENKLRKSLNSTYKSGHNALFLVRPEGDFTDDEIDKAIIEGFESVVLGDSRLRVETAGIVACAQINFLNFKK